MEPLTRTVWRWSVPLSSAELGIYLGRGLRIPIHADH